jgi:F0F1-type ATP synthase beta subunit
MFNEMHESFFIGLDCFSDRDFEIYNREKRLESFLIQPFYIAESFTKVKGEYVSLDETMPDVSPFSIAMPVFLSDVPGYFLVT